MLALGVTFHRAWRIAAELHSVLICENEHSKESCKSQRVTWDVNLNLKSPFIPKARHSVKSMGTDNEVRLLTNSTLKKSVDLSEPAFHHL